MDHNEAVRLKATERYLLGELTPEQRDTFEEHLFDCADCTLDLRAAAAFVEGAKAELPSFRDESRAAARPARPTGESKRRTWLAWLTPQFAVPAFAALLAIVCYQNLATIPALRSAAREPRVLPWATLHAGTRGSAATTLLADPKAGAVLLIDLPEESLYSSYGLQLDNPQGKHFWNQTVVAPPDGQPVSLLIPGPGLRQGAYTLTILGITPQGSRAPLDRRTLNIQFQ